MDVNRVCMCIISFGAGRYCEFCGCVKPPIHCIHCNGTGYSDKDHECGLDEWHTPERRKWGVDENGKIHYY